jgi:hypothetical protein
MSVACEPEVCGCFLSEATLRTRPSSGQATISSLLRHRKLLACHSGAALDLMTTDRRLSSPNRMVWELFQALRRLCARAAEAPLRRVDGGPGGAGQTPEPPPLLRQAIRAGRDSYH